MSSLVSSRMSDLYGPLNYSRGAAAPSSSPPGFSSASFVGSSTSSASCGSDFRRVSPGRVELDPSFPADYTSDDSSGSTDVHQFRQRNRNSANQEPLSSANRNRKRSRRPEMDGNNDMMHEGVRGGGNVGGGAFNSVVAPKVVRQTANARERDRTHSVNSAFMILRTMIPTEPADRKLSKIETLRLATSYISHLHTMLLVGLDVRDQPCHKHQALVAQGRRTGVGRGTEDGRSTAVCTFCLTGSKTSKAKNQSVRAEQCMFPDRRMQHLR